MTVRWITPADSLGIVVERITIDIPLSADSDVGPISFSLLAGSLPRGLRLDNGSIKGSPTEVRRFTESRFVIRASDGEDIEDRTFTMSVDGSDAPVWLTREGFLNVGQGENYFVLDNAQVDFQLEAYDSDVVAGDVLEYYLIPSGGELPPGLTLTRDGRITGFTDPLFSVEVDDFGGYDNTAFDVSYFDKAEARSNGYDSFLYDITTFDYNEPSKAQRKLSRFYTFIVAVSDGVNEERRLFRIWVVSDEFLKSDNSIIQVDTNLFRADNTANRRPIWLTDSDLGIYRANNYLTVFLDVYDPPSLSGTIVYLLLPVNPGTYRLKETNEIITDGNWEISQQPPGFSYKLRGNWDPLIAYRIGDAVFFNDLEDSSTGFLIYACIANHINQKPSSSNGFWTRRVSVNTQKFFVENPLLFEVIEPETQSQLPPGMTLDSVTGEIAGRVPYQSRVSRTYKFTMQAIDFPASLSEITYTLQGDWRSTIRYRVNQAVRYKGLIYICTQDNINRFPDEPNSIFWQSAVATSEKTFKIEIIGEIDSGIEWITDNDLGTIKPNQASTKSVEARSLLYGGRVVYELTEGKLPPGLELLGTGDIVGKVKQFGDDQGPGLTRFFEIVDSTDDLSTMSRDYSVTFDGSTTIFDKIFRFKIKARDTANFSEFIKEFSIRVITDTDKTFVSLYFKAFQPKTKRLEWSDFITDNTIFRPNEIYRYGDPNFGLQTEIKVLIYAGIETMEAVNYVQAMSRNHYRKKLKFGEIKSAVAKNPTTQEAEYEVIYVEIVDEYEKNKKSISETIDLPDYINSPVLISYDSIKIDSDIPLVSDRDHQRIFPNSIKNMRNRIKRLGERDRTFLPLWMRTIQDAAFVETGYLSALVICYVKPELSQKIISRIKNRTQYASRGPWSPIENYRIADSVFYEGIYYTSILEHSNKNPRTEGNFWVKNFNFQEIDFTVDRYIIDILDGEIEDKYLAFPQIGEKLP